MTPLQIIAILTLISEMLGIVNNAAARARERGEWTPEEEQRFDDLMAELKAKDYWRRND